MIGFDLAPELSGLKNQLLTTEHIFTGEAKPSVIRLLPPLSLSRIEADQFLTSLRNLLSTPTHSHIQ
jgi:acetylornithine aminotransferase